MATFKVSFTGEDLDWLKSRAAHRGVTLAEQAQFHAIKGVSHDRAQRKIEDKGRKGKGKKSTKAAKKPRPKAKPAGGKKAAAKARKAAPKPAAPPKAAAKAKRSLSAEQREAKAAKDRTRRAAKKTPAHIARQRHGAAPAPEGAGASPSSNLEIAAAE